MLLAYISHIIFAANSRREGFSIKKIHACEVESSWKNQTDLAQITLPRSVIDFDKAKVNHFFRKGDAVEIHLGYNGQLFKRFTGYITEVSADIPVVIKLQDEMWKLKQLPANVSIKNATLTQLIREIAPGYEADVLEANIGSVRFSQTTVAEVLKKLQSDFGINSYFQEGKLIVGKIYEDNTGEHTIHLENDLAKNDLKFVNADDISIKIKAVSTLFNGTKIEAEVGDEDGEERQLSYYNIESESDLKALAQIDYDKYKKGGFEGNVETFAYVNAIHGDKVNLVSSIYPERNGTYYIDKVADKLANPTYHRIITIGAAV